MTIHINPKTVVRVSIAVIVVLGFLWAVACAIAAPYPTGVGGTGTSQTPASGTIPIGTGSGTYTPAYLLCTGNCSVSSASGTVAINVPAQTTSTVTIYPVSAATSSFAIVGDGAFISISNPATSTIKVSFSASAILQLISATSPLTYNSSTGQLSCASCLTSLNGALLVANNLSDVASTTAARNNLGLGSIATYSKTDYLTSSTVYVSSVNGSSGAVTITSSTLGVISLASFSASGTGLAYNSSTGVYTWTNPGYITTTTPTSFSTSTATNTFKWTVVGLNATITIPSNVSFFTNDAGYLATNTGNWSGTWQGATSSTFYLASNPSHFIALTALSAAGAGLTYNSTTGVYTWTNPGYAATSSSNTWSGNQQFSGGLTNASGTHIGATYAELVSPVAGEGDFTSIQPAITADCALPSPGIVYVKNGTYDLGSTGLTVSSTCSGFGLIGESESSTRITYEGTGTAVNVGDNSGSISKANVGDFSLVGSSSGLIGINAERVQVSNFHDLYITGFTQTSSTYAAQGKGFVFSGDSTLNADNYTSNVHEDHNDIDLLLASTSNANYFTGLDFYGQNNPSSTLVEVVSGVGNTLDITNLSSATNGAVINTSGNIVNIGYGELLTNELVFGSGAGHNFAVLQAFSNVTTTVQDNSGSGTNNVFANSNTFLSSTTITTGGITTTNGQGNFYSSGNGAINSFRGSTGNYDTQCVGTGTTAWWCLQLSPDGTNNLKIVDSQDGGTVFEGDTNGTTTVGNSGTGSTIAIGTSTTNIVVSGKINGTTAASLASSSVSFVLTNPTTTSPYNLLSVYTNTKKNIVYVDCWEAASAATTTIKLFYNTTLASTSMQQIILSSLACTSKGTSTTTFTTSTLPLGAYLFADVSSTAGTPTQTTVDISATKL